MIDPRLVAAENRRRAVAGRGAYLGGVTLVEARADAVGLPFYARC